VRAKAISSVAMPVAWEELSKFEAANVFTLRKALKWLDGRKRDPWKDYFQVQQKIALLA